MSTTNPISRRSFLAATGKLGAAGLAASTVESLLAADTGAAQKPAWQLGCYTRVFDQFDYPVALDAIAEAGFKYVGLMSTNSKPAVLIRTSTPVEEVQAISDAARKRGLKVLSVYGEAPATESLDEGVRGLKQLIDDAAICECPNLMLAGTTNEKLYQLYYKTIAECCDYAAAKGVGRTAARTPPARSAAKPLSWSARGTSACGMTRAMSSTIRTASSTRWRMPPRRTAW